MKKLFVLMGKSATGKDTIYKQLLEDEKLRLMKVVSYTTRPIRIKETDGVEYHFVSEEFLEEARTQGTLIEERRYDTTMGPWYYFLADDGQMSDSEGIYLIISTPQAYESIRAYFGETHVIPIYVTVDDGDRLTRSITREKKQEKPNYAEVCRRYLADEKDFSQAYLQSLGIVKSFQNDVIEDCLAEIKEYVLSCSQDENVLK